MTDILRRAWRQTDISTPSSTFPQEAVAAVGDQPFSISHDAALERLVVSAIVADDLPAAPRSSRRSSATSPTWRRRPQVSLFRRDLIPHIAKPGWFEE